MSGTEQGTGKTTVSKKIRTSSHKKPDLCSIATARGPACNSKFMGEPNIHGASSMLFSWFLVVLV